MQRISILVVDDNPAVRSMVRDTLFYLYSQELEIVDAEDGVQGLEYIHLYQPDLVMLDIDMPRMNGLEVLKRIREDERTKELPVVMLTAAVGEERAVESLNLGADYYVAKPWSGSFLCACVRALLQKRRSRHQPEGTRILRYADIEVDIQEHLVWRGPHRLEVSPKQFDLLVFFLRHPRQILSRETILEHVWGFDFEGESTGVVDVYVGYLRKSMEVGDRPRLIHTERGVGYVLKELKKEE